VLEQGGTVVAPSRQRAVAIRLAHTRSRLQAGSTAWSSCDVLPFGAWLEREASQARHGALRGLRRLGAAEEWLLWREAALLACEGNELLQPASLAEALRRSAALVRDHGLAWPGAPTSEAQVLGRARRHAERRCAELGAYSALDWSLILRGAPRSRGPLFFAGCDSFGAALRERLVELGATFAPPDPVEPGPAAATVIARACADATDELRRAAQWCRAELQRDPAARLLVVVPQLAQRRAAAMLAFEHELGAPAFVIEGGQALDEYPVVSAALTLLRLCGGPLEFQELAALLRSPYIGCGSIPQRAALELALRERNVHAADLVLLGALARGPRGGGEALAAALDGVAPRVAMPRGQRASAAEWARRFAAGLDAGGWPGAAPLGSEEQQQCERLRALLGELALVGAGGAGQLEHGAAVELLAAMARRTAFEAASGDVPVTLTATLDDPLVRYAGIWVAGLGAEHWPAPPRPDPFVPIAVQRAAGLLQASPQGQLESAQRAMRAWRRCAKQLVLSWPESDGDVELQPSGLVARPRGRDEPRTVPPVLADPLYTAVRAAAVREPRAAEPARAWPRERPLPGGTRALQLQSLCPFRAVAELRLGAAAVSEPVPGLDYRERGQLLHRALQLVWTELGGSGALRAMAANPLALMQRVAAATAQALRERLGLRLQPLAAPLVHNELERTERLIHALLQQDLERADTNEFQVVRLEEPQQAELAGVPLRLRMDRVDRLDDGRVVVIDYKSGAAESFRPLAARPRQAQLLAYALLAEGDVAAVAAVHLNAGEVRWRGAAAQATLLPRLAKPRGPTAPWPELLAHWRAVIDALALGFAAGAAAVQPQPGACRLCHLGALCRVDATRHAAVDPDAEDAGDDSEVDGGPKGPDDGP
jgi:ATP-dependent helicase/nuclease subunit B